MAEKEDLQNNFVQLQSAHSILSDQLNQLRSEHSSLSNQFVELQVDHTHLREEHETTLHELHQASMREEDSPHKNTTTEIQNCECQMYLFSYQIYTVTFDMIWLRSIVKTVSIETGCSKI